MANKDDRLAELTDKEELTDAEMEELIKPSRTLKKDLLEVSALGRMAHTSKSYPCGYSTQNSG